MGPMTLNQSLNWDLPSVNSLGRGTRLRLRGGYGALSECALVLWMMD